MHMYQLNYATTTLPCLGLFAPVDVNFAGVAVLRYDNNTTVYSQYFRQIPSLYISAVLQTKDV